MLVPLVNTVSSHSQTLIRFERLLPGPIERVWSYLTEPDKLAKWLAAGSTEPRVGGIVELTWQHDQLSPHVEPAPERYKQYQGAHAPGHSQRQFGGAHAEAILVDARGAPR